MTIHLRRSARRAPETNRPRAAGEYTLDEIAKKTGVPNRTIRFYQAKGVLSSPQKRGRIALYDDSHVQRIETVGKLQDKGLRLRAIRDLVGREDLDSDAVQKWLGLGERLGSLSNDSPQLLTEDELRHRMGNPDPGVISRVVRKGLLRIEGDGEARRYLVLSPALLDAGKRLRDAGIDIDTVLGFQEILQRRFAKAAREVVQFAVKRLGQGFARSQQPEDIMVALEALFRDGVGGQAAALIFNKEIERAVRQILELDEKLPSPDR